MGSRVELLKHWYRLSRGSSYWASSSRGQPGYHAGDLNFYYRDYTAKTRWDGALDADGMPLVQEAGATPFRHPLILAQKALGHWDICGRTGVRDGVHHASFLRIAECLRDGQEGNGGWSIASMKKSCYVSPYSALAQGQIASVLVRAAAVTADASFISSARRGLLLMLRAVEGGGTARVDGEDLWLEEYPRVDGPSVVLNGWISALFGLYDYSIADSDDAVTGALHAGIATLSRRALDYDAGYWSYYDRRGTIASPYYHRVHAVQLDALARTFPAHADEFARLCRRFESYERSRLKRARAVARKVVQKLRTPPDTVLALTKAPRR